MIGWMMRPDHYTSKVEMVRAKEMWKERTSFIFFIWIQLYLFIYFRNFIADSLQCVLFIFITRIYDLTVQNDIQHWKDEIKICFNINK